MRKHGSLLVAVSLSALFVFGAGAVFAGGLAVARTGGSGVEWQPAVSGVGLSLTVSGPQGFYLQQQFKPGESPTFSVFDASGNLRPAGNYAYELRPVVHLDAATRDELQGLRDAGDEGAVRGFLEKAGKLPSVPEVQAGYFAIVAGTLEMGGRQEAPAAPGRLAEKGNILGTKASLLTNADGVIRNSLCVGFDCPASPTFSDSTILMMENNTRIKFGDTSVSPFPNEDWEIEANSASSGGQSYLGINDCGSADNDGGCATDLVFAVEAGAPQNALYVENDGDVGIGTSNPVLDLHIVTNNTPGIRLEQNSSGGFTAQTWDLAGNESNFFVRDVTGGSRLPFRIRPGAPTSSIDIAASGNVGIGTASPSRALTVIDSGASDNTVLEVENNGPTRIRINNTSNGEIWNFGHQSPTGSGFVISDVGDAVSAALHGYERQRHHRRDHHHLRLLQRWVRPGLQPGLSARIDRGACGQDVVREPPAGDRPDAGRWPIRFDLEDHRYPQRAREGPHLHRPTRPAARGEAVRALEAGGERPGASGEPARADEAGRGAESSGPRDEGRFRRVG